MLKWNCINCSFGVPLSSIKGYSDCDDGIYCPIKHEAINEATCFVCSCHKKAEAWMNSKSTRLVATDMRGNNAR